MKSNTLLAPLVAALTLAGGLAAHAQSPAPETPQQRDARMAWWREAKFGLFIHWGLYSVPAGIYDGKPVGSIGEWIMSNAHIPVDVYAKYAKQFNPVKFNAERWVLMAKNAGMKYIVITSKHHDGFAMFHSKATDYNIGSASPFKTDPLKELAAACKRHGIRLGFYYSQCQDWHHAGGEACNGHWDKAQEGSFDTYLDKIAIPQVKEILTHYGPVAVLWWDTPTGAMTPERSAKLNELLKLQPGIITNNRLGGGFAGDTETPEQTIPATGYPGRDWESCMTLNDTWGYKSTDTNWKSTETLLHNLIDIASKGGNYLLNVGPTSEGLVPQASVERLAEVGRWMKVNGEAIYGTKATPFGHEFGKAVIGKDGYGSTVTVSSSNSWRCTSKPGKLYIHIFEWPQGAFTINNVDIKATKAYLLADPARRPLKFTNQNNVLSVSLPAAAPDKIASVLVIDIDGKAVQLPTYLAQDADGTLQLTAQDGEVVGSTAKLDGDHIGYWMDAHDAVHWPFDIKTTGTFAISLDYALDSGSAGSEFAVSVGDNKLVIKPAATGSWDKFQTIKAGELKIDQAGKVMIKIVPVNKPGLAVMNFRSLKAVKIR